MANESPETEIEVLTREKEALQIELIALKATTEKLEDKVASLEEDVENLEYEIDSLTSDKEDLEETLSSYGDLPSIAYVSDAVKWEFLVNNFTKFTLESLENAIK
jgi:uncharacterized protein YoxC